MGTSVDQWKQSQSLKQKYIGKFVIMVECKNEDVKII